MNEIFMPIAIFIPIILGIAILFIPFKNRKQMMIYIESVILLTSVVAVMLILNRPDDLFILFSFAGNLKVGFDLDGVGSVFVGIVSLLWPLATLYAFEYMEHENHQKTFFTFYTMTYGVTLAIALAKDILTMYIFYEMLTLVTLPLIIHSLSKDAIHATRKYLYYSLGGAAFAFIGVVFILIYGSSPDFTAGGVLNLLALGDKKDLLIFIYFLCFCGFSVKAAMCPFSSWLPTAGVAPTPVTALLHAVAVVKAGAFACIRVTYFSFGTELLKGSWAQNVILCLVIFTIVYGCSRAVKETHIKRRLAWSTVSNLSYILFGCVLMTPAGLLGALTHMIFHAVMKITSFFCAGSIMHKTHKNYIHELDGLGRKMPITFIIFTISAFALMGVPGLCGFISKWYLASGAIESGTILGYIGVVALLISALLTVIYMVTISVRAFFPGKGFDYQKVEGFSDPGWKMLLPLCLFIVAMFVFGLHSQPLVDMLIEIVSVL
ncbi:MAG: proton-conducting transporter membrane subunit [Bacilli bacterium]|nr:proton-conducting transporter membrane subunit [Bacilli bacterium]